MRLRTLIEPERLSEIEGRLTGEAETLRFAFDREVGEHTSAETIASDLLVDLERVVARERLRAQFLR